MTNACINVATDGQQISNRRGQPRTRRSPNGSVKPGCNPSALQLLPNDGTQIAPAMEA